MSNDHSAPPATSGTFRPGWYPDPIRRFDLRFHNGRDWTADVSNGGDRFVDPLGVSVEPPTDHRPNPLATAAMVLGIVAVTTAWMPFLVVIGIITALIAVPIGIVGVRRAGANGAGRGRALAGAVLGSCALAASVLGVLLTIIVFGVYDDYLHPAPHEIEITACDVAGSRVTMTGDVTNLGEDAAKFSILVGFTRPGTDDPRSSTRSATIDVEPDETTGFEVQRQVDLDAVDCVILDVNGPLPFGLSLD